MLYGVILQSHFITIKNFSMTTLKMQRGAYYVGDPCYLFDQSWGDVLNETSFFSKNTFRGEGVAAESTAHGDGVYKDNEGKEYWVDSGMLGILPISLAKIDNKLREGRVLTGGSAHIVKFDTEFDVEINSGVFKFGHLEIDTNGDDEEEED